MAESVIFLKLSFNGQTYVNGSATLQGFADQIEIESFGWGAEAEQISSNLGKAGKDQTTLKMRSMELSKFYDKSSVKLMSGATNRTRVKSALLTFATLIMTPRGEVPSKVLEMEMSDGYIEGLKLGAQESGKSISVKEDFTLSFTRLKLTYTPVSDGVAARKGAAKIFDYQAAPSVA